MTQTQRQTAFQRFFTSLAKARAERLGLGFAGTIRKLPPPPLPGEATGTTRYFLNAVSRDGSGLGLVALAGTAEAALRRAERWVATGIGAAPAVAGPAKLKRKV
jgi:hypothetical protein